MNNPSHFKAFGRRKEPHTIIIAHGDEIRHFTVRPWLAGFLGSALAAVAIGYLLATSYLVLRDDLIDASAARQARIQQAYEDRISALRAQVDRITSRQVLDQRVMETKVGELMLRQSQLTERHGKLGPLLGKLGKEDVVGPEAKNPRESAEGAAGPQAFLAPDEASTSPFNYWSTRTASAPGESMADKTDKMFLAMNQSLRSIESEQLNRVTTLAEDAYETADAISDVLDDAGLTLDGGFGKKDVGGPYLPPPSALSFDGKVQELDEALAKLERIKGEITKLPIANPAPGRTITSTFGVRKDPLMGTPALHAGMDFRAPSGSDAHVTASGVVVKAGWNGGYGRMVEVDHGNGFTTRYAHLSRILVSEGDRLDAGALVGRTGSSGRSTGPHLHYEVRRNGDPIDPLRFIKAGRLVNQYL